MKPQEINIDDYSYNLPAERIAQHPVALRDKSKLLIASRDFSQDVFSNITSYLPSDALMVFNDTKVFHARLDFRKNTGARIEVFLLEPLSPVVDTEQAFQQCGTVVWKCLVGNSKKWKDGILTKSLHVRGKELMLNIKRKGIEGNAQLIEFQWDRDDVAFGEIVEKSGSIPLPPYMRRQAEEEDEKRYQTVYARQQGSVAAPTAGLHFTPQVLQSIENKGIEKYFVTLDVGAGTFKPVKSRRMEEHQMHTEKVYVSLELIKSLKSAVGKKKIIAVGTTTVRTLESLFWFGVKLEQGKDAQFAISQWEPYRNQELPPVLKALQNIENHMIEKDISILKGQTQIIIAPGYSFKIIDILITNFHQPKSTLLLLVAAFYGEKWKEAYRYALDNDFRFLSYGDSCLFMKSD